MADYTTTQQIAAFAQEFDALSIAGQDLIATAASRLFDNLCEVPENFFDVTVGTTTVKTFIGDGTAYLRLLPYVSLGAVTPVVIPDGTAPDYLEQNGYLVIKGYGAGIPTDGRYINSPWPSDRIYDYSTATNFTGWPVNCEVQVTAIWGFAAIPADVTLATIQLAIHLWRTGDAAFTSISQSGEPNASPAIPLQAAEIATKYRDRYSRDAVFA